MARAEIEIEERQLFSRVNSFAAQLEGSLDDAIVKGELPFYKGRRAPAKRLHNYASDLNHPCARNLTYPWLDYKQQRPKGIDQHYRFKEGNEIEARVKRDLGVIGFDISSSGQEWEWPEYRIKGKIDGTLPLDPLVIPVEVKSISPHYWSSTRTVEQIKDHPKFWIRKICSQLNLYMLMMGIPAGILILVTFGKKFRILPMQIDYELGEYDIQKAELVNQHVDAKTYPPGIPFDPSVCGLCDFDHLCKPIKPTTAKEVDKATAADLTRYCDLEEAIEERKKLAKTLIGKKESPGLFYDQDLLINDIEIKTSRFTRAQKHCPPDCVLCVREDIPIISTSIKRLKE